MPDQPRNRGHVNDPKLTAMVQAQRRTKDPEARKQILVDFQRYAAEQQYYVYLFSMMLTSSWQPYLKNFCPQLHLRLRQSCRRAVAGPVGLRGRAFPFSFERVLSQGEVVVRTKSSAVGPMAAIAEEAHALAELALARGGVAGRPSAWASLRRARPGPLPPRPRHALSQDGTARASPPRAVRRHRVIPCYGHDLLAAPGGAGTGAGEGR